MTWIAWCGAYVGGAIVTAGFNYSILVYVTYPFAIIRNAVLWPIMLPVLAADFLFNEVLHGSRPWRS